MKNVKIASAIFVYLAVQGLAYGADIIYRHAFEPTWPAHARYHVMLNGLHVIVFALVTAVVAIGGLRKARRTAWITLAIVGTLGWLSWPLARAIAGEPPALWVQLVTGFSGLAALLALAISYKPIFSGTAAAPAGQR